MDNAAGQHEPGLLPSRRGNVVLRTEGLTKCFESFTAVDHLSIDVYRGDVYGLLGPNGSGKTTTLRMILGLIYPSAGRVRLLDHTMDNTAQRRAALRHVGAIVEQPGFYPFLSGRENLSGIATFSCMPSGVETDERIEEVLELVGLATRANDLYRNYSLGMKQRLALAATLLNRPEVILLDEPTNGLDPAGVVEIRTLIGELAAQGLTVVLSSHQLYEIQQVCSRVAIIKRGKLLLQGRVRDILADRQTLLLSFYDPAHLEQAAQVLRSLDQEEWPWLKGIEYVESEPGTWEPPGGHLLSVDAPIEHAADLNAALAARGIYATEIRRYETSLEHFFLELTGNYQQPPEDPAAQYERTTRRTNPLRASDHADDQ